jgi:hypothetical protein
MVPIPASTGPPAGIRCWLQIPEEHMCLRSPDVAKMDPSAADMALAVWNGYVQDARRHARQWRPVEQVLQDGKDVKRRGPYTPIWHFLADSGCRDRAMLVLGSNTAKQAA